MACSYPAMEEDRVRGTGPELGPPIRTSYERELEPQLDLNEDMQHWWGVVYFDHTWDERHGHHNTFCRFCDGIENVREVRPSLEEPLMRYVKSQLWKRSFYGDG